MKAAREHRIPLSEAAMILLKSLPRYERCEFLFPGGRRGKPLSNRAMLALLKRMGYSHITAHGFRSTFRDWAAEETNHPGEVAEMALAHIASNRVEAAYRRGDLFEKRRQLTQAWGRCCNGGADIVEFRRKA